MKKSEKITIKGTVRLIFDSGKIYEYENLVTDAGLSLLFDWLSLQNVNGISYVAIGTGTTSPSKSDTQLENETFRKAILSYEKNPSQDCITFIAYITSSDYTGDISELGLFGGDATETANTGTLFSRVVITPVTKTNDEGFVVEWKLTFSRGA